MDAAISSLDAGSVRALLLRGMVIPAHPIALTPELRIDETSQRALTRYYLAAGAGGIAVGVHTTQFEIHNPGVGLYRPALQLAAQTVREFEQSSSARIVKIAGIIGRTAQAVFEAGTAREAGFDAGLLSLAAFRDASDEEMLAHCRTVAEVIPLFGFYLQPSIGGRILRHEFWRSFAGIENVVAIKIAPFNRYQTLDVARAIVEAGRADFIPLYTGNDDTIIADLLQTFPFGTGDLHMAGGLLGHWAFWTKRAVETFHRVLEVRRNGAPVPLDLLRLAAEITDVNGAVFDAVNGFAGCIAGIHEMLRRDGMMDNTHCVSRAERLSPGQAEEIGRVRAAYPHLRDDAFIQAHRDEWRR